MSCEKIFIIVLIFLLTFSCISCNEERERQMHRTEASGNVNGLFTDGPPATCLEQNTMNALQEEICNVIEGAGLTLHTAATDTRDQLLAAINLIFSGGTSYGFVGRPVFTYKDADEIYISPGIYHHYGTSNQIVVWHDQLTFQFGPGGSNPDSEALAGNQCFYLYLDNSAIVTNGSNIITSSQLVANTTAPTWNNSKHGWYNGLDRCIFGIITTSGGNIEEFCHSDNFITIQTLKRGGQTAKFDNDYSSIDLDNSWDDVYLPIPSFAKMALVSLGSNYIDGDSYVLWRLNGSSATGLIGTIAVDINTQKALSKNIVTVDSNSIFEIKHSASNGNIASVYLNGWYLPNGM